EAFESGSAELGPTRPRLARVARGRSALAPEQRWRNDGVDQGGTVSPTIPTDRRTITRRIAGGLAAAIAIVYFLIGFEVVTVWEGGVGQRQFGLLAGSAFLAGAVVISFTDKRVLW